MYSPLRWILINGSLFNVNHTVLLAVRKMCVIILKVSVILDSK